jgi:hypothetical protein
MTVIKDFFTLKVADVNGHFYKATWKEKLRWIRAGCPHPNYAALSRLCRLRRRALNRMRKNGY